MEKRSRFRCSCRPTVCAPSLLPLDWYVCVFVYLGVADRFVLGNDTIEETQSQSVLLDGRSMGYVVSVDKCVLLVRYLCCRFAASLLPLVLVF